MILPRLLAITDRRQMGLDDVRRLARPDVAFVVREKDLSARALMEYARAVLAHAAGSAVLITDRVDVARALGAGIELPEDGLGVDDARRFLGPDAIISASRHDRAGAVAAALAGADWITLAPVFATPSKPGASPLGEAGLSEVARALRGTPARLYALGGIDASTAALALRAGADGVAAIRAAWSGALLP